MFPLNTVLFPGAPLNLHIFEPRYRQLVAECLDAHEACEIVAKGLAELGGVARINDSGVRILHAARSLRKVAVGK